MSTRHGSQPNCVNKKSSESESTPLGCVDKSSSLKSVELQKYNSYIYGRKMTLPVHSYNTGKFNIIKKKLPYCVTSAVNPKCHPTLN